MGIKKVWRDDSVNTCVACKICQSFAPRVFRVFDKMIVMPSVDYNLYEKEIMEAADSCPTGIIKIEYTMKVAVWDTYVMRNDGLKMHFDIVVPEKFSKQQKVYAYGKAYLKNKEVKSTELSTKECEFCHIEEASEEMILDIETKGYYIIEMENC